MISGMMANKFLSRRRGLWLPLLTLALIALAPGCAYLNGNFRAVDDGRLYRSGQLHADALQRRMEQHDIAAVISLRSPNPDEAWYHEELAVCDALDVPHYSLGWSKNSLPEPASLQRYVTLLQDAEGPVLVHCQGGVHRSSIASAVYVLMQTDSVRQAREQLARGFDHAPIGALLDLYARHDEPFIPWVSRTYPRLYAEINGD